MEALREKFEAAVKVIQSLPKNGPYQPSNSVKLKFYSLFKQATEGKCNQVQPSFFNVINRAKWDAWNRLGDMSSEDAMNEYIEELKKIIETMSFSGDVQNFLDAINPFYEFINLQGPQMSHVKEALDEWTSSSSSPSLNSSSQNSPLHSSHLTINNNSKINYQTNNGHLYHHIPSNDLKLAQNESFSNLAHDKISVLNSSSDEKDSTHQDNNLNLSKLNYLPPGAPTHHRSSISCKNLSVDEEILEVDFEERSKLSSESPTDCVSELNGDKMGSQEEGSEMYFSGENDEESESDGEMRERMISALKEKKYERGIGKTQSDPNFSLNSQDKTFLANQRDFGLSNHNTSPSSHTIIGREPTCSFSAPSFSPLVNISNSPSSPPSDLILITTVERLNRDIEHILARVRLLEAASYSSSNNMPSSINRTSKKLGFGLSRSALALILSWPFIAYFIIKLVGAWLRRRR